MKKAYIITLISLLLMTSIWLLIGFNTHADTKGAYTPVIYEGTNRVDVITRQEYFYPVSENTVLITDKSVEAAVEEIEEELERYPKFKQAYIKAFDRMIVARSTDGKDTEWKTGEEVMQWWISK